MIKDLDFTAKEPIFIILKFVMQFEVPKNTLDWPK